MSPSFCLLERSGFILPCQFLRVSRVFACSRLFGFPSRLGRRRAPDGVPAPYSSSSLVFLFTWRVLNGFPAGRAVRGLRTSAGDTETRVWRLGQGPQRGTCSPLHVFAWKIPWAEEPGELQNVGLQRVRHDWAHAHTRTCTSVVDMSMPVSQLIPPPSPLVSICLFSMSLFVFLFCK